jgi:multidrug efflux system membrane fusion protein
MKWTALALGLGLSLIGAGCNRGAEAGAAGGFPPPAVTVAPALTRDVPVYLDEIGKAVASEMVTVQPQVTGMVMSKHFVDGADVHKGDLLFNIDPRPFLAVVAQAKAQLAEDQAALQFAKDDFKRVEGLQGTSAVSQQEYDQKKNTVDIGEAKVQASQAALDTANLNLAYCQVFAPIDGRTGARLVDPGNVVNAGGPNGGSNLLVIQKVDPIYADFTIAEANLPAVQKYMADGELKVEVQLPEDATAAPATQPMVATPPATTQPAGSSLPAAVQPTFQPRIGQLTFLDNAVQDGTGTVKLRATLPNKDRHFWPGQFVNVRLVLMVKKDAVLIPNQAIQISQTGPFVYVVKSDSTIDQRNIVLGQRQGDSVVVQAGLEAGEKIVVTGQQLLMPGGKVTVQGPVPMGGAKTEG